MKFLTIILTIILVLTMTACDNTPKAVERDEQITTDSTSANESGIVANQNAPEDFEERSTLIEYLYGTISNNKYQNKATSVTATTIDGIRLSANTLNFELFEEIGITEETTVKEAKKLIEGTPIPEEGLPVGWLDFSRATVVMYMFKTEKSVTLNDFVTKHYGTLDGLVSEDWSSKNNNGKVIKEAGIDSLNRIFVIQSGKSFIIAMIESDAEEDFNVLEDFLKTLKF